jgi:protein involved in polysaccharide export with SLBB domain
VKRILPTTWVWLGVLCALPFFMGCSLLKRDRVADPVMPPLTEEAGVNTVQMPKLPPTRINEPAVASRAPYRLRQGDPVVVFLRGIMPKDEQIEEIVDDRGYITMPYIDDVMANGRTSSELERDIQRIYIERKIYRSVTVNVVMPSQSFFVQGEVRLPQRYPLVTGTTVMQAIAAAGGYSEFADPKKVTVTRGRDVKVMNMREVERNPQQDMSVESGDVIRVPRSIF